jgi:hypothetical protein
MARYRIIFLEHSTGGEASSRTIEAADDREAMQHVIDLRDDRHAEVWHDKRLIIRIAPIASDVAEK